MNNQCQIQDKPRIRNSRCSTGREQSATSAALRVPGSPRNPGVQSESNWIVQRQSCHTAGLEDNWDMVAGLEAQGRSLKPTGEVSN